MKKIGIASAAVLLSLVVLFLASAVNNARIAARRTQDK